VAGILSVAGWAAGWLTVDGAAAAFLVGSAVLVGTGWPGGILLGLFFVTGSVLTQFNRRSGTGSSESPKRGRDAKQVLANGLWAAVGAALAPWRPDAGWSVLTGALAAAQSDTWATELGARSARPPRLITTWVSVPRGTSGAITPRGTLGGLAGAAMLWALGAAGGAPPRAAAAGFLGGVVGLFGDSVLGATVQARFRCDGCGEDTERRRHRCGRPARHVRGWKVLDNDGVNLVATGAGAFAAVLFTAWL
jgi:uncharacterized protein (TIGR00297 family)